MNNTGGSAPKQAHAADDAPAPAGPRVLLVPDGLIPTTHIIEPVLREALGARFAGLRLAAHLDAATLHRDALLFSRVCDPLHGWLPGWLSRHGARYAYFLDDNLWAFRSDSEVGRYYARSEVLATLDNFIRHASCVLVSSERLRAALIERFGAIDVRHVTAPFDFSLIDRDAPRASVLRVGYAGSERGAAFEPVAEAIARVLAAHPGAVEFEFIGYVPPALDGLPGVTAFPAMDDYADFLAFKQSRGWHVGLAPLADDDFNRAKTNNKVREYGALGIAGLFSRASPYVDDVSHGTDGLLVDHSVESWQAEITRMIESPALVEQLGVQARRRVWERHRMEVSASSWYQALRNAYLAPATPGLFTSLRVGCAAAAAGMRARIHAHRQLLGELGPILYARRVWGTAGRRGRARG